MLLISPGDNSASLHLDSLQAQPDQMLRQSGMDCDPVPTASTWTTAPKTIVGDRDEALAHTSIVDAAPLSERIVPPASAQISQRQRVLQRDTYPRETERDGLYALRRAAGLRTLRSKQVVRNRVTATSASYSALDSYAAPLSPLRERDLTALSALFQRDDIYTIEADVSHRLLSLLPEPCWEEDVFTFLKEFL